MIVVSFFVDELCEFADAGLDRERDLGRRQLTGQRCEQIA
jgi:hypothetical protein